MTPQARASAIRIRKLGVLISKTTINTEKL